LEGVQKLVTNNFASTLENALPVLPLYYLPPVSYFALLLKHGGGLLEQHEHFTKQSLRNRAYINTAQGVLKLSIPVLHHGKVSYKDLLIDNSQNWQALHWRSIQAGYGKAPYFQFYAPYFEPFYKRTYTHLWDYNLELLTVCLQIVKLAANIEFTDFYEIAPLNHPDYRNVIKNTTFPTSLLQVAPYQQVFGVEFEKGLSIIDLVFCCGPDSKNLLLQSIL